MEKYEKFSVLMSLYIKEKPEYVRACFNSLLQQTVTADEWVIVEDGPLTKELYDVLREYQNQYNGLIHIVKLESNQGLGNALKEGVLNCRYELIARMDTDDIARSDRFEKQLLMFKDNPELDICGSHIREFEGDINRIVATRRVPLKQDEILKYQKRRDGFNHVSVMFKKTAVLRAGNYQQALLMEDSLLWVNMIQTASKCANIDDYLVYVRTGEDLYRRRGGFDYFKKYKSGRKKIYETGYISWFDYAYTIFVQFCVALVPNGVREVIYRKFLRKD